METISNISGSLLLTGRLVPPPPQDLLVGYVALIPNNIRWVRLYIDFQNNTVKRGITLLCVWPLRGRVNPPGM